MNLDEPNVGSNRANARVSTRAKTPTVIETIRIRDLRLFLRMFRQAILLIIFHLSWVFVVLRREISGFQTPGFKEVLDFKTKFPKENRDRWRFDS